MQVLSLGSLILLCVVAAPAAADTYRCRQPDGSTAFQDRPCPAGSSGSAIAVSPAAGAATGPTSQAVRGSAQQQSRDADRRRQEQEAHAREDEAASFQKAQRCHAARQQLGVLKEGRPVFRRDNAGERHYVDDKDRARETVSAQQRVGDACS